MLEYFKTGMILKKSRKIIRKTALDLAVTKTKTIGNPKSKLKATSILKTKKTMFYRLNCWNIAE